MEVKDRNMIGEDYKKMQLIREKLSKRYISPDKRIEIYQEDAVKFLSNLPSNSVDLIITDPAYSGMNQMLKLGKGRIIGEYKERGNGGKWFEEFHDTEANYNTFLLECARVLRNNRHIYIMFDSYSLLSLGGLIRNFFSVKNVLTWDKVNIGMGHYFRRRHEFVIFASKGKRKIKLRNIPDVWRIKRIVKGGYPAQKPTEIFELMIIASAEKDFIVCDPFLGSGSSAIASIKHGCRFIGCDIAEKSFDMALKRIKTYIKDDKDILQKKSYMDEEVIKKILENGKFI